MAETPLQIIQQNSEASARFFQLVNQSIAQDAAHEVNLARTAASIVGTTFQAREAQRVNNANIRSTILFDQVRVNEEARKQAEFQLKQQLIPLQIRSENLKIQAEQQRIVTEKLQQADILANKSLAESNQHLINDAFSELYRTKDPTLLNHLDSLLSVSKQNILSGSTDLSSANKALSDRYQKSKLDYDPSPSDYNPATTAVINRLIGEDQAKAYELEFNPNYVSLKRSQRAEVLQNGTPDAVNKMINSIADPEEKEKIQKAHAEIQAAEHEAKTYSNILKKYTDVLANPALGSTEQAFDERGKPLVNPDGTPTTFNQLTGSSKEAFVGAIRKKIDNAFNRQQQVIQAVQLGADIPDPVQEVTNELVTGATGQTAPPTLTPTPVTEEARRNAEVRQSVNSGEVTDAMEVLQDRSLTVPQKYNAAIARVRENHGLVKTLAGVDYSRGDLVSQIKENLDDLSEEELAILLKSEGQILDKVVENRKRIFGGSIFQSGVNLESKRARTLKRIAEEGKAPKGATKEGIKLAFAEALAEEINRNVSK